MAKTTKIEPSTSVRMTAAQKQKAGLKLTKAEMAQLAAWNERALRAWETRRENLRKLGLIKRNKPTQQLLEMRSEQANRAVATRRARKAAVAAATKRAQKAAAKAATKAVRRAA